MHEGARENAEVGELDERSPTPYLQLDETAQDHERENGNPTESVEGGGFDNSDSSDDSENQTEVAALMLKTEDLRLIQKALKVRTRSIVKPQDQEHRSPTVISPARYTGENRVPKSGRSLLRLASVRRLHPSQSHKYNSKKTETNFEISFGKGSQVISTEMLCRKHPLECRTSTMDKDGGWINEKGERKSLPDSALWAAAWVFTSVPGPLLVLRPDLRSGKWVGTWTGPYSTPVCQIGVCPESVEQAALNPGTWLVVDEVRFRCHEESSVFR